MAVSVGDPNREMFHKRYGDGPTVCRWNLDWKVEQWTGWKMSSRVDGG